MIYNIILVSLTLTNGDEQKNTGTIVIQGQKDYYSCCITHNNEPVRQRPPVLELLDGIASGSNAIAPANPLDPGHSNNYSYFYQDYGQTEHITTSNITDESPSLNDTVGVLFLNIGELFIKHVATLAAESGNQLALGSFRIDSIFSYPSG